MEHKGEYQKGRMKEMVIQFALVLIATLLIHFIFNGEHIEELAKLGFPQSLAIAIVLRLSFYPVKSKTND
ncbi:hypothetical protein K8352_19295 [Flavobacteriaceae bacterium F89]|uniref:Uncharacterized protein n=1 Tax=Cerina litoralis TaxID=2874477 RepID=A0AAE3JV16_9FLAO|nr:hypothetical protein [Cerina litoralis]MCG2462917.1 hypothetical protein [Cerina litoralis]